MCEHPKQVLEACEAVLQQSLSTITHNALIHTCTKSKQLEQALLTCEAAQWRSMVPDAIIFSVLISASQPQSAKQLLETMQWQDVLPELITYSASISACKKGKQSQWTLDVIEVMQHRGIVPDIFTYSALTSACEQGKPAERVFVIFEATHSSDHASHTGGFSITQGFDNPESLADFDKFALDHFVRLTPIWLTVGGIIYYVLSPKRRNCVAELLARQEQKQQTTKESDFGAPAVGEVQAPRPEERLHYLDNLKVFLTVQVATRHSSLVFGVFPVGCVSFTTKQGFLSAWNTPFLHPILRFNQSYFMSLFLFISGYFLPSSLKSKGVNEYDRDKFKRYGIPTILNMLILNPL